jgi:putative ABC transport system ATP-binding protein
VTALRADRVYRFYRSGDEEVLAVQGVSLEVSAGEVLAVRGPSGSGKSTLLACLGGLDEPSGGTVWVEGKRLSGRTEGERAAIRSRSVGIIGQSDNLFPHLTLLGNLRLAQALVRRHERAEVQALLQDLGLASRAHAWPEQLSGGELVRASLAVALANQPSVLLADEPTGELDEATESRVLALLRRRSRDGCAIVVASHSDAVIDAADRTIVLVDGRLS